jgi:hypothetical protein
MGLQIALATAKQQLHRKLHSNASGTGQISGQYRFANKLNQSKRALTYTARAPRLSS